jgi:hypothetical protein
MGNAAMIEPRTCNATNLQRRRRRAPPKPTARTRRAQGAYQPHKGFSIDKLMQPQFSLQNQALGDTWLHLSGPAVQATRNLGEQTIENEDFST